MKNSIRHNLSLHNRFKRIQSEGTGKSSWWIINPDEKNTSPHSTNDPLTSNNGVKQARRRLGQTSKTNSITPKRLRTTRTNTKSPRILTATTNSNTQRQQESTNHQISSTDLSSIPVYDTQSWSTQLDSDPAMNLSYEQDPYSTSVHTPLTNTNSTGGLQSTYALDDISTNYVPNTSSNPNHTSEYSYHHSTHFHHHHHHHPPPTHVLYQHHHGTNYETSSNNGYYHQTPVLNDHHLLPMDNYHSNNGLTYPLPQQQTTTNLDPNDDQHVYLRVHSTSSHSSSASLSPPILTTTTNNLTSSSSSASSSSSYSYPHKNATSSSSSSGGYLHPTSNGTLTLYSHHHQHHSDIETLLHLNTMNEDLDDDDDDDELLTLVHHHDGMIDDHQQLSSFPLTNHQVFSHHEPSTSILRTVLKRPIVGKNLPFN